MIYTIHTLDSLYVYYLLKEDKLIESITPGIYAGWRPGKIFGTLDCASGKRMHKQNRVFFEALEDAITQGYRPCQKCRPLSQEEFEIVRHLVPQYTLLEQFYKQ